MIHSKVLLLLALSAAPAALPALPNDLEELVAEEVRSAPTQQDVWARALALRDADRLGAEGELDRALDGWLGRPEELSPEAAMMLVAARLSGEDPDAVLCARALLPVLENGSDPQVASAAGLFGSPLFRGLRGDRKEKLLALLLDGAESDARAPATRLAMAGAAHAIGNGREGRRARQAVLAFLDSQDPDLRARGALTQAGLRGEPIEGRLRSELERLARIPDGRGELAATYLEEARAKDLHDRRLKDLRAKYQQESGRVPTELREFMAVMQMIEGLHLEGNDVEEHDLMTAAMNGMLHWMDQHSSYLSPEAYAKFFQDLEAEYGGIGAYVGEDPDNGLFSILRPIYSGPAYEAGLLTDDKIVRIGDWSTLGKDVEDIIKRLKGKPGTDVKLYVWRRGMDPELIDRPTEDMVVNVKRAQISIPAGSHQLLPGGIGLAELDTFSQVSREQLAEAIDQMKAQGMRALVLDLRRNSGGLLTEAREVADLFLGPGKVVVSTEGRLRAEPDVLRTRTEAIIPEDMPLVILTGRYTASAAEIVSGAMKDHGRAQLVGKRTFGKGSVQQLIPLRYPGMEADDWTDVNQNGIWDTWEPITVDHDGDGVMDYAPRIKLTIAHYLLPSGRSIHRQLNRDGEVIQEGGVEPDFTVDTPLIDRWRYLEQSRIVGQHFLRDYVDQRWDANRELFTQLAFNDQKNAEHYPDFDELFTSLGTSLPRDDVRRLLRTEIRRRVQDERGQEFPAGDFEEDVQLQKAIQVALSDLGEDYTSIDDFGLVFDLDQAEEIVAPEGLATLGRGREDLSRARNLILQARDGGHALSDEELDELLHALGASTEGAKEN